MREQEGYRIHEMLIKNNEETQFLSNIRTVLNWMQLIQWAYFANLVLNQTLVDHFTVETKQQSK